MKRNIHIPIILIFALSACVEGYSLVSPYTTIPAAAIGVYEKANKRDKWLKYAEAGDVYAQFELAKSYCCSNGFEGKINTQEAFKWYCSAAKGGLAKAQVIVGKLYENSSSLEGVDIEKDNAVAYMWFSLAARKMNNEAIKHKKALETNLQDSQIKFVDFYLIQASKIPCGIGEDGKLANRNIIEQFNYQNIKNERAQQSFPESLPILGAPIFPENLDVNPAAGEAIPVEHVMPEIIAKPVVVPLARKPNIAPRVTAKEELDSLESELLKYFNKY